MLWNRLFLIAALLANPADAFLFGFLRRLGALEDDVDATNKDVESIKTQVQATTSEFETIKTDFGGLQTNVGGLETSFDTLTTDVQGQVDSISTECQACGSDPVLTTIVVQQVVELGNSSSIQVSDQPGQEGLNIQNPLGIVLSAPETTRRGRRLDGTPRAGQQVIFGEENCAIGARTEGGVFIKDPMGASILNPDDNGSTMLKLGPTDDCRLEVQPTGPPGIQVRDPTGVRLLNNSGDATRLLFGPTDDCTIGVSDDGLTIKDVNGVVITHPNQDGKRRLLFGNPTCRLEVDPNGPSGIQVRDPEGLRLLNPESDSGTPGSIIFGPGGPDEGCRLGGSRDTGMTASDPVGFRIVNPRGGPRNLFFGPENDCRIQVDNPNDTNGISGLQFHDKGGVRIINPDPTRAPVLHFGPTDECRLEGTPDGGITASDKNGFRILHPVPNIMRRHGARLLFGETDNCTIGIDPDGPDGIQVKDPKGLRLLGLPRISFGDGDDLCTISATQDEGMTLKDVKRIRVENPDVNKPTKLVFGPGPNEDCRLQVDPGTKLGLQVYEPNGLRLRGLPQIFFGPTDLCNIGSSGEDGIVMTDPNGARIRNPNDGPALLAFGEGRNCSITAVPNDGMTLKDVRVRIMNPRPDGANELAFGMGECSISARPNDGMTLKDVRVTVMNPRDGEPNVLDFGDGQCSISAGRGGMNVSDPVGLRLLDANRLLFGPTDDCTIGVDPNLGLTASDPRGFRVRNIDAASPARLFFGSSPDDLCSISATPGDGMTIKDIRVRIEHPLPDGKSRLNFGAGDQCGIGVEPDSPTRTGLIVYEQKGLRLANAPVIFFGLDTGENCSIRGDVDQGIVVKDVNGLTIQNPTNGPNQITFGTGGECRIEADSSSGVQIKDPNGVSVVNPTTGGSHLLGFGPAGDCTIRAGGRDDPSGLLLSDPRGARLLNPDTNAPAILTFGPTDECRIRAEPNTGMVIEDPLEISFQAPNDSTGNARPANVRIVGNLVVEGTINSVGNVRNLQQQANQERMQVLETQNAQLQQANDALNERLSALEKLVAQLLV